jgi:tRNA (guanosine-2'-O-)-methyltransferase
MNKELIDYLSQIITPKRFELFQKVVSQRTRYLTVVLEDIFQSHNASAVLRSCDCFGVQNVHLVENYNQFEVNPEVDMGSSKWLTLKHYNEEGNNTIKAINQLKADGYRIVATTPHEGAVNIEDFDLNKGKVALVFGTELKGISNDVKENADEFLKIPMYGFTESFNISVSVALILHNLSSHMRSGGVDWPLNEVERDEVLLDWMKKNMKHSDVLIREFIKRSNLR